MFFPDVPFPLKLYKSATDRVLVVESTILNKPLRVYINTLYLSLHIGHQYSDHLKSSISS